MAHSYKFFGKAIASASETTLITSGSNETIIIKSIRVTNKNESTDRTVSFFITDSSSVDFQIEMNRTIQKKSSLEILASGNLDQNSADSSVSSPTP